MSPSSSFTIGQVVWFWSSSLRRPKEAREPVAYVVHRRAARFVWAKRAERDTIRFDPETLEVEIDGSIEGEVWESRAELEEWLEASRLWEELRSRIQYSVPRGVPAAPLRALVSALNTIEEEDAD